MRKLSADPIRPLTPSEYYHCCLMVGFARTNVGCLSGTNEVENCDYPFDGSRPLDAVATLMCTEVKRRGLRMSEDTIVSMIRDLVNWQLIPRMVRHGFPLKGFRFEWDEAEDYTPEQQVAYERMLLGQYEVDPQYFIDKYNVNITGIRQAKTQPDAFFG